MSRKRIEKNLAYDDGKRLFYVYFDYGRDAFGRRMRKTKTFSQKEMAKEALCRFEIRRLQNRLTPPTQMTLEHWLSYWLEDVIRPNREDTTYYCYHSIITNLIVPILGKVKIQQLTPYQIQAYYNQIMREKGLSSNTVYKHHILLHTALKMAHRQKLLPENPIDLVEAPHQQLPSQSYYNPKQLNKLFRAVEGDWLEIVVKLAGYLGLRRSEICGLRWEDVDLENGVIQIQCVRTTAGGKVVEKQPKSESSIRKLGIAGISDLVDLLREERFNQLQQKKQLGKAYWDSGYVVVKKDGSPCQPNQVTNIFRQFIQLHGLPHITIHGLRHTFASVANSAKVPLVDIGKALGHKDITITGRIYTHLFDQTHQEVLNMVASRICIE